MQSGFSITLSLKVLILSLLLTACTPITDSGSVEVDEYGQSSMQLRAPDRLLASRAVVEENLILEVSIQAIGSTAAQVVPMRRVGGLYTGTFVLDERDASISSWILSISWFENVAGENLLLATHDEILRRDSVRNIVVGSYNTDHDNDNDGQSNLSERINGTDPNMPPMMQQPDVMQPPDDPPARDIESITPVSGEGQTDCRSLELRREYTDRVDQRGGRSTNFNNSFILPEQNGSYSYGMSTEDVRAHFGSVYVSEPGQLTITVPAPLPPNGSVGWFSANLNGGLNQIALSERPSLAVNVNAGIYCFGFIRPQSNPFLGELQVDLQFQPASTR